MKTIEEICAYINSLSDGEARQQHCNALIAGEDMATADDDGEFPIDHALYSEVQKLIEFGVPFERACEIGLKLVDLGQLIECSGFARSVSTFPMFGEMIAQEILNGRYELGDPVVVAMRKKSTEAAVADAPEGTVDQSGCDL